MAIPETIDFVRTGPGTLAGRYLRTFWQPVYRAQDLAAGRAAPIRIMGEDFTLYRGQEGSPHVTVFRCAHRGTQLSTGWVEGDSLRCRYHGWRYDGSGQCVEQPGEEEGFANKVRIKSYPTKEYLGLIFAYLGDGEPPPLRRYHELEGPGVLEVYPPEYWPCNYFNRIDNACDAAHIAFTHQDSRAAINYRPEVPAVSAEETEYGVRTTLMRGGKITGALHFHMPNTNHFRTTVALRDPLRGAGGGILDRLLWRIPVDDERCVSFPIDFAHLTGEAAKEYQERRQQARLATVGSHTELAEDILAGKLLIGDIKNQSNLKNLTSLEDYVTQVGQGAIPDRSNDRLGRIDVGLFLLRKLWERELKSLADGVPLKKWTIPEKLPESGRAM